jgi:hypothetical protein
MGYGGLADALKEICRLGTCPSVRALYDISSKSISTAVKSLTPTRTMSISKEGTPFSTCSCALDAQWSKICGQRIVPSHSLKVSR